MKPNLDSSAQVRIGSFELDIQAGELHNDRLKIRIQEQPREVLAMLLDRPGEVVTREELRRRLWPDHTFVDFEHGLNKAISKLREALGDDADRPRYIETLPRRGYRFIAPVESVRTAPHLPEGQSSFEIAGAGKPLLLQRAAFYPRRWRLALMGALVIVVTALAAFWLTAHRTHPRAELQPRPLTANPMEYALSRATVSPDGNYLAYSDPAGIHVKVIASGVTHTVTPQTGSRPGGWQVWRTAPSEPAWEVAGWFPDATTLLADLRDEKGESIWTLSILGGPPHKLRDGAEATAVSPDGSLVAFTAGDPTFPWNELWLMGPQGEGARKIATSPTDRHFLQTVWAPDGRHLATMTLFLHSGGRCSIETRDLTGGSPIPVESGLGLCRNYEGLLWLPDGRLVYSLAEPPPHEQDNNLWEIRVDLPTGRPVGKPRRVTNWAGFQPWSLSATADGKRVTFIKGIPQSDVWIGELAGKEEILKAPWRLTLDQHYDIPFAWTPDSKTVFFLSDRTGTFNIFKQALDKDSAESLTTGLEFRRDPYSWKRGDVPHFSPDGLWILYSEVSQKDEPALPLAPQRLMRMPATGGPSLVVLEGQGFVFHHCARSPATLCVLGEWSPDGKQVVFTAFDPEKGRGRELGRIDSPLGQRFLSWDLSPDGSRIAYSQCDEHEGRIHFLSPTGRTIGDLVVPGWSHLSAIAWATDGKGLFLTSIHANAERIVYVDLEGRAYSLWEHPGPYMVRGVPSPDGRYLALSAFGSDNNAWIIERF